MKHWHIFKRPRKLTLVKTAWWQKILLIIFGVFLTVILLETGLRLGGFVLLSIQEHRNACSIKDKNTYRILCLGESTTQNHWPPFLQEILNQRNRGIKFSVIDKGLGGTNTSAILERLEINIKQYQPHMVITMMGINDYGAHMPIEYTLASVRNHFLCNSKIYKLIRLIILHLKTKLKTAFDLRRDEFDKKDLTESSNDESVFVNLGSNYLSRHLYKEAQKAFWKAIKLNPKNPCPYGLLRVCYREQANYEEGIELMRKHIRSNPDNYIAYVELAIYYKDFNFFYKDNFDFLVIESMLKKAIAINPKYEPEFLELGRLYLDKGDLMQAEKTFREILEFNPYSNQAYLGLAWLYRDHIPQRYVQAEEMFKKAIEAEPKCLIAYLELGRCYMTMVNFAKAEEVYKKAIELDPNSVIAHRAMAILYKEMGEDDLAAQHLTKIEALYKSYYPYQTAYNYLKFRDILTSKGIRLVCVQYPMRSAIHLRDLFGENREGVLFVDNESSFKNAVKQNSYAEYFTDNFAGDFGHCTPKGNRLLAENIANVILEYFNK